MYAKISADDLDENNKKLRELWDPNIPFQTLFKQIKDATKDIDIQIVFNNAGFLVTGFFDQAPLGKLLVNMECM